MADVLKKVPVREQDPAVRAKNFEEVCYGYNKEEAMEEASRCINCKNAKCIEGCPVSINIPAFVHEVKEGNFEEDINRIQNVENISINQKNNFTQHAPCSKPFLQFSFPTNIAPPKRSSCGSHSGKMPSCKSPSKRKYSAGR